MELSQEAKIPRTMRYWPPRWLLAIYVACLPLLAWAWQTDYFFDATVGNIICWIVTFLMLVSLTVWFLFFSQYAFRRRLQVLAGCTAALVVFFLLFRMEGTTGTMVPTAFRLRWSASRDHDLRASTRPAETPQVDLRSTSDDDFPQFLGPQRNAVMEHVTLARELPDTPWKRVWRQPIGAGWSGFVVVHGAAVTMEQRGPSELVTCYELATGKLLWTNETTARHETFLGGIGPRATPAIADGDVFALGGTGILRAIEGATGKSKWSIALAERYGHTAETEAGAIAWGRANSPLVHDHRVIVPVGGAEAKRKTLAAFDAESGEMVWEAGSYQISYSSPVLARLCDVEQIVTVVEDYVVSHAIEDGKPLWQYPWPGKSNSNANVSQPLLLPDNHVLLSKGYGGGAMLLHIEQNDGTWKVEEIYHHPQVLRTKFTNACASGDFVYGLDDGILTCLDWRTGKRRWKEGRYGHGQLLRIGDRLLVQSEQGEISVLSTSADRAEVLQRFSALAGKTWNNPCVAEQRLLVRNDQEAACYELPVD